MKGVPCNHVIEYKNQKVAEKVIRSLEVDDFDFVKSKLVGSVLKTTIESKSVSSLIHTLDDFLACISVAEKVVDKD